MPLVTALVVTTLSALSASQPAPRDPPSAELHEILDRALERAAWAEEQNFETRYRHTVSQRVRQFDGGGEVTQQETGLFQAEPYRGVLFYWLTMRNGQPISESDRIDQDKRWQEFQAEVDAPRGAAKREKDEEDDNDEIKFNEELISRYTATLEGIREFRGRASYVLSFEPRPGKLPVRRQIDHALNKSRGEVWIDQETHEIARLSFQMVERVRLWWGILGSISNATGHLERQPVDQDVWLNTELDLYFHVRIFFKTTRRSQTTQWSAFTLAGE